MSCPHKICDIETVNEIGRTNRRQTIIYCRLKQTDINIKIKIHQHEISGCLSSFPSDICHYSKTNEHNCLYASH